MLTGTKPNTSQQRALAVRRTSALGCINRQEWEGSDYRPLSGTS